jgi:hypothetical protein
MATKPKRMLDIYHQKHSQPKPDIALLATRVAPVLLAMPRCLHGIGFTDLPEHFPIVLCVHSVYAIGCTEALPKILLLIRRQSFPATRREARAAIPEYS